MGREEMRRRTEQLRERRRAADGGRFELSTRQPLACVAFCMVSRLIEPHLDKFPNITVKMKPKGIADTMNGVGTSLNTNHVFLQPKFSHF
jgi:hypothetical protein